MAAEAAAEPDHVNSDCQIHNSKKFKRDSQAKTYLDVLYPSHFHLLSMSQKQSSDVWMFWLLAFPKAKHILDILPRQFASTLDKAILTVQYGQQL